MSHGHVGQPTATPAHPTATAPDPNSLASGYERHDASIRAIVVTAVVLTVVVVVVMVGIMRIYRRMYEDRSAPESPQFQRELGKNTQIHQREQLLHLRAQEDRELTGYGWVDRKAGVVRLPIDRAIDLVVERGLAAPGGGPKTDVELNSHAGTPASATPAPPTPATTESQK